MAKKEKPVCLRKTSIGGQALLEGIMMRGPKNTAMAVRNLKGEIVTEEFPTVTKEPAKIWKLPLFRGLYGMAASLKVGYKCMMRSAILSGIDELAEEEERENKLKKLNKKRAKQGLEPLDRLPGEEEPAPAAGTPEAEDAKTETPEVSAEDAPEAASAEPSVKEEKKDEDPSGIPTAASENGDARMEESDASGAADGGSPAAEKQKEKKERKGSYDGIFAGAAVIGSVLGVALAVFLFIWLPIQLYGWTVKGAIDSAITPKTYPNMLIESLFEGLIRIIVFILYMFGVSQIKDIKRTFMYHGAEHKTIFCYEGGLPLTVENVRKMSRFHPRCGTSFLIVMLILGIIIGSFIPQFGFEKAFLNNILRSLCKIALFPITVGIGYEFIRYAGKHDNVLVKILSAPGLWMQRISTKEPEDGMIECAITAVKKVIPEDGSDAL